MSRRRFALGFALLFALGVTCAALAVRVAHHARGARIELSRFARTQVDPDLRERLAAAPDEVFLTLFLSPRHALPSRMRGLESDVLALCESLREASGGKLDFQVVDPASDPDLERYAARRRVAPVRVRSIERDGWSERTVWASLEIASGARAPAVIQGLEPEDLPSLQARIAAHLEAMEQPLRPRIALAPRAGWSELEAELAKRGDVVRVDLDGGERMPDSADLLVWMDPAPADSARVRALELLLAGGRSALVAGSPLRLAELAGPAGRERASIERTGADLAPLLAGFGVVPQPGIWCDSRSEPLALDGRAVAAPFAVRCIAYDQDFHTFRGQPNGNLLFLLPAPLLLDGERLAERQLAADVLATTSDGTWVQEGGAGPLALAGLGPERGSPAPKQPLIVALRPRESSRGWLVACAASTPFQEGLLHREGTAHGRLLKSVLDTLASDERLVQGRIGAARLAPIPELAPAQRLLWRAFAILLAPALLAGLAFVRRARAGWGRSTQGSRPRLGSLARAAAALVACAALVGAAKALGARADLTEQRLGELAPATRELARRSRGEGRLEVELLFSPREDLPPALREGRARLVAMLRELRRAGAELESRELDPADLAAARREELEREGLELHSLATRDGDVTRVRRVYAAARIASRGRSTLLAFPDALAFEELEFRLAFALWRLEQGRGARVAFASDLPRPSPAEAWEFQQQGLFSPMGSDAYALARERLRKVDFELAHVSPRDPALPRGVDALVWLQPRRPAERMLEALVHHLHGGGRALVAAQHFVVQSRQYRGTNFEIVYWPQPQMPEVEMLYFPWIGVHLVREPFFDRSQASIVLDSQMKRSAELEYRPMALALPFVVRASAAHFEPSAVTRNLGDQLLPFAARFELDGERLADLGLRARVLIWSSPQSWSFDWKGGWIPPELLAGPPPGKDGAPLYLGPQPLAVELEGSFPLPPERLVQPTLVLGADGVPLEIQPEPPPYPPEDLPPAAPGRLVLVGASELFKNNRLLDAEFRADHLLVNAVASLALPEDLAAVASKRAVTRGFGLVEPRRRLAWRLVAVGAFPALIAAFGLVWRFARRSRAA